MNKPVLEFSQTRVIKYSKQRYENYSMILRKFSRSVALPVLPRKSTFHQRTIVPHTACYPTLYIKTLRDNLLARPPKRVDRRRGTKCVGLKCICVVKTLSRGIICIKTSFFLFFSNFGSRETLISSPGILKDRSSSNIQCPEGSYNTQQIMNTRCFLGD